MSWSTSELRVRLAPLNRFKPSSKIFYWPFQGGTSFVDLLCFVLSCVCCVLCASVYMCFVVTCWERADLLALVCAVFCEFVTFPLVSWVRCGTWLYRFLIFATLLTFILISVLNWFDLNLSIFIKEHAYTAYRMLHANNKETDQPAYLRNLISSFVIHSWSVSGCYVWE